MSESQKLCWAGALSGLKQESASARWGMQAPKGLGYVSPSPGCWFVSVFGVNADPASGTRSEVGSLSLQPAAEQGAQPRCCLVRANHPGSPQGQAGVQPSPPDSRSCASGLPPAGSSFQECDRRKTKETTKALSCGTSCEWVCKATTKITSSIFKITQRGLP